MKMKTPDSKTITKALFNDIRNTNLSLLDKLLLRDYNEPTMLQTGKDSFEVSYSGRNDSHNILFDERKIASDIIEELLKNKQYTILLYDKSIILAEYKIEKGIISKGTLHFIKKHNYFFTKTEIDLADSKADSNWWDKPSGTPVFLRFDYEPGCMHADSHLTLSNCRSCRIPVRQLVPYSNFVEFVLYHFYDIEYENKSSFSYELETITDEEKKKIHINWME